MQSHQLQGEVSGEFSGVHAQTHCYIISSPTGRDHYSQGWSTDCPVSIHSGVVFLQNGVYLLLEALPHQGGEGKATRIDNHEVH